MTLLPRESTYHEFTDRNLQVAKRQEDTSGWVVCGGWQNAKAKFLKMVFPNPLFCSKSPFGGATVKCNYLGSPPKCSNGSCLAPPFWGSHCTGNQNKEWKSGRKLYVVIRYIPDFNWDIPCNNNQIYSNISSLLDSNFNSSIGNMLLSFTCNYNVVKKIYQDNLKHQREEVRCAVFFPTNLEDFIWGQFFFPGKNMVFQWRRWEKQQ